ncbi:MAG: hypothetical protein J4F34_05265 [Gemmatimonadetes bacterium]|nr:hypothetical protein [Gemmatimonadota bacterium]
MTATDDGGNSESVEFQVLVTSEPPMFTGAVTADAVGVGRFGTWDLYQLFEPAGKEMTFEATSDFPGLIVGLTDSLAYFTGTSEGQAQVMLTATNRHGGQGSGTISVTVWAPELVFVDEFDSDASLDDWETLNEDTELTIVDEALVVTFLGSGDYGIAARSGENVDEFYLDITTRIETGGLTGVIWLPSADERYRLLLGDFDDDANWRVHRWDQEWMEVFEGNSPLVSLDQYRTYSIILYDWGMHLLVDGQDALLLIFRNLTTTMADLWLIGTEDGTEYDRVQLSGRPGSTSDHDTAERAPGRMLPHELMITVPPLSEHH